MTNVFDWFPGNSALTFAHPWLLLLLLAIPLLAWLRGKSGPAAALTYSSTASLRAIGKKSAARVGKILRALLFLALAFLVIALARPQLGKSLTQIEASGIDIMLVLDVSGSMLTKDFTIGGQEATRVDAIREVTQKFIEARPNDRIGIIAFAGRPYVVSPMTLDHDWLLQNLDRIKIGLVEDGTAIGSAMASASNRLNDKRSKSHVLVLLTDGENNAGKIPPNTAAEAVKALKIHFYAIGAGINGIAPAPVFTSRGPLTDALGNILYENQPVQFNETGLREVTKIADGKFFRATDTQSLEQIFNDIDKLEKSTVSVKKYQQYRDLFPLCLMGGCGLLVAQMLLSQKRFGKEIAMKRFWSRTRMALGIVAHPALDCALCALGTSRIEAAAAVRFRATAAAARGNRQSATAHRKIWFVIAWACAGDRQSGATALGLHL